jgi:hypothetical protein
VLEPAKTQENCGLFAMEIDEMMQLFHVAGDLSSSDAQPGCSVE